MPELLRVKNVATKIQFPLLDATTSDYFTGTAWGSLTNASLEAYSWGDGTNAVVLAIAGTPTEIGTTGLWSLSLTQAELNPNAGVDDYIIIKLNADEIMEQALLINLKAELYIETLIARLTSARAGYLDKLNISGNVAGATALSSVDSAVTSLNTTKITSARAGYIDKLNVTGTLLNTDNASTFMVDSGA